jgi:hypothetical protein
MVRDGDAHRAKKAEGRDRGQQTDNPAEPTSELRHGGKSEKDTRDVRVGPHPAEGVLDLGPAMENERHSRNDAQEQQRRTDGTAPKLWKHTNEKIFHVTPPCLDRRFCSAEKPRLADSGH